MTLDMGYISQFSTYINSSSSIEVDLHMC